MSMVATQVWRWQREHERCHGYNPVGHVHQQPPSVEPKVDRGSPWRLARPGLRAGKRWYGQPNVVCRSSNLCELLHCIYNVHWVCTESESQLHCCSKQGAHIGCNLQHERIVILQHPSATPPLARTLRAHMLALAHTYSRARSLSPPPSLSRALPLSLAPPLLY